MKRRINVFRTGILFYLLTFVAACSPADLAIFKGDPEAVKTAPAAAPPATSATNKAAGRRLY